MDKGVRAHEEHLTVVQAHEELPAPQVCSAGVRTQELDRKQVDAVVRQVKSFSEVNVSGRGVKCGWSSESTHR